MRAQPPPRWRDRVACYLHREWVRLRKLARFPLFSGFERFDRARLVEMEYRVELIRQSRVEIMALPLGFGTVDHTDRPLEPRTANCCTIASLSFRMSRKRSRRAAWNSAS